MNSNEHFVLVSVHLPNAGDRTTDINTVVELLDIDSSAIDQTFGLVSISPDKNLYAVMIKPESLEKISPEYFANGIISEEYANPKIEHFGLPPAIKDHESENEKPNFDSDFENED